MPELATADVVGAEFGSQPGFQPDHLMRLAGPPAFAARRASGEASTALQRGSSSFVISAAPS